MMRWRTIQCLSCAMCCLAIGMGCRGGMRNIDAIEDNNTHSTTPKKTQPPIQPAPGELRYGSTPAHRLNVVEYTNSINHIFKLELDFGQEIPRQTPGDGFLNVAGKIVMAPGDLEDYLNAAKRVTTTIDATPTAKAHLMSSCTSPEDSTRTCAANILKVFLPRLWRGDVTEQDHAGLLALYDEAEAEGIGFTARIHLILHTALISPKFLFRTYSLSDNDQDTRTLTDHELASRLSYFLWSSTPDDELLTLAKQGKLSDPDILEEQIERMLTDEQARYAALGQQFFEAWLGLDRLRARGGDPAEIQMSLAESNRMFWHVLSENRPFHELLTADYMFINTTTASLYNYPVPQEQGWVNVEIDEDVQGPRRGVIGQRAFLSRYTGVVFRGVAINKHLLCTDLHIALPDEVLDKLNEQSKQLLTGEISELTSIAQRREDLACKGCHGKIDSAGYSLFEFDNLGAYRTEDEKGNAIDPSVTLSDTLSFEDGAAFIESFKDNQEIEQCMVRRVLGYATGREIGHVEDEAVKQLWTQWKAQGTGLRSLFKSIASSEVFRTRDPSNVVLLDEK